MFFFSFFKGGYCLLAREMDASLSPPPPAPTSLTRLPQRGNSVKDREIERKKEKERKLHAITFHHNTNNPPTTTPPPKYPVPHRQRHLQHPPAERGRAKSGEERRRGGRGHVIRRACGHSFTPRQNERGLLCLSCMINLAEGQEDCHGPACVNSLLSRST